MESFCGTWSYSSTPSRVSIPGLGVCPVRRLRRASVRLIPATAGRRLRGGGILGKFGFHPAAEVFEEGVCKTEEELNRTSLGKTSALFLLPLLLPGSTSIMRLSCVRLLRSSWLKVLSIITISDDGLERCRAQRGNPLAFCMS